MGKNQDPGSGINIPDPQHCVILNKEKDNNLGHLMCLERVESRTGFMSGSEESQTRNGIPQEEGNSPSFLVSRRSSVPTSLVDPLIRNP
jgi:hypothetical protein